jgi:hypothetical protein
VFLDPGGSPQGNEHLYQTGGKVVQGSEAHCRAGFSPARQPANFFLRLGHAVGYNSLILHCTVSFV